jgi:hypothetical protein
MSQRSDIYGVRYGARGEAETIPRSRRQKAPGRRS